MLKNAITELKKNTLEGFHIGLDEVEQRINKLEDKAVELNPIEQKIEKKRLKKK